MEAKSQPNELEQYQVTSSQPMTIESDSTAYDKEKNYTLWTTFPTWTPL